MLIDRVTKGFGIAMAVLLAWGCTGGAPVQETASAAPQAVDATGWDRIYRDAEGICVLNIRYLCDTIIAFEYTAADGKGERRTWAGRAGNQYGWLACEFFEGGDNMIPADEYLYGTDGTASIRLSMPPDCLAQVRTDTGEGWSPIMKCD